MITRLSLNSILTLAKDVQEKIKEKVPLAHERNKHAESGKAHYFLLNSWNSVARKAISMTGHNVLGAHTVYRIRIEEEKKAQI